MSAMVKTIEKNGFTYFSLEDVARGLGFTTTASSGNICVRWERVRKYLGLSFNPKFISKEQFQKLLQSTNRVISREWYELAGLTPTNIVLTKEQETIGFIEECFKDVTKVVLQKVIGNYKIDLYFPEYRIAVECDELGHEMRDADYEAEREKYISEHLKCQFVRYNPDEKDFKINSVISEICRIIISTLKGRNA